VIFLLPLSLAPRRPLTKEKEKDRQHDFDPALAHPLPAAASASEWNVPLSLEDRWSWKRLYATVTIHFGEPSRACRYLQLKTR